MDFTREPIIETVITPKEGCKIVVRSSKGTGQEEYFVDSVEVISFGSAFFYRSLERPKSFLVPVSDYEIVEVREARMVLKHVGVDRSIKIGGGREASVKAPKEPKVEKEEISLSREEESEEAETTEGAAASGPRVERLEKKRDRRRQYRRRRGREEQIVKEEIEEDPLSGDHITLPPPRKLSEEEGSKEVGMTSLLSSLLPPPPTLISETIARYKDNAQFKNAFFLKEEAAQEPVSEGSVSEGETLESFESSLTETIEEEQTFESIMETEALPSPSPFSLFEDEETSQTEEGEESNNREEKADHSTP